MKLSQRVRQLYSNRCRAYGCKPFYPSDIASLTAWYEADPAYCYQDGGGTIPCGDGDPIALWQDRSGNRYDFVQTDPLKRPTLRLVNGKWCALFDGINDYLSTTNTNINAGSQISLFTTFKKSTGTSSDMFERGHSNSYSTFASWCSSGIAKFDIYLDTVRKSHDIGTYSTTDINLTTATYDLTTIKSWLNGSNYSETIYPASISYVSPYGFTCGCFAYDPPNYNRFDGHLYSVILYSKAVSDIERGLVHDYLNKTTGVILV